MVLRDRRSEEQKTLHLPIAPKPPCSSLSCHVFFLLYTCPLLAPPQDSSYNCLWLTVCLCQNARGLRSPFTFPLSIFFPTILLPPIFCFSFLHSVGTKALFWFLLTFWKHDSCTTNLKTCLWIYRSFLRWSNIPYSLRGKKYNPRLKYSFGDLVGERQKKPRDRDVCPEGVCWLCSLSFSAQCCFKMRILSGKCTVRWFCHCMNITVCASRNLDDIHSLLHTQAAWDSWTLLSHTHVQYVTVLSTVVNSMCCTTTLQHLHSTWNASGTADTSANERLCIRSTVVS